MALKAKRVVVTLAGACLAVGLIPAVVAAPFEFTFDDPPPWTETPKPLPAFPKDADLLRVNVDAPGSDFKYFIDSKSLAITDDGVVAYTVVEDSGAGARSVLREGIHCGSKTFKIYASGLADARFEPTKDATWQPIKGATETPLRGELYGLYLCDAKSQSPFKPRQIIGRIQSPPNTSPSY